MRAEFIAAKNIAYIFTPTITTDSSSCSAVCPFSAGSPCGYIWPPCNFTVSLDCRATDGAGKVIWETSLKAEARVRLLDLSRDRSLTGKEAITEAFLELQNRIVKSGAFR